MNLHITIIQLDENSVIMPIQDIITGKTLDKSSTSSGKQGKTIV